jgi:hypothetical protein
MPGWSLILIGFLLSILGSALPFLMILHIIPSTFFLNFLAFGCMMSGLIAGIAGAANYMRQRRK